MLQAAGIPLYRHLNVHGYWLVDDRKMSKSLGNVIRPLEMVKRYGNDAFRYFLVRDMSFGLDASFSEVAIAERVNSDLANDLGNLLNRTLGMLQRYRDGVVPAAADMEEVDVELRQAFTDLPVLMARHFDELHFDRTVQAVMEAGREAIRYTGAVRQSALTKDDAQAARLDAALIRLREALRVASIRRDPGLPGKAHDLCKQLEIRIAPFDLGNAGQWGL